MTKLEKLYASIKRLQELGLPLNEETLRAADDLEEQLINSRINSLKSVIVAFLFAIITLL